MGKSEETKERIIEETIRLIQCSDGNVREITIRKIAENANVGVGLINHYFDTKEALIERCVQRIIGQVITAFQPGVCASKEPCVRIGFVAKQVMDFLMEHPEISQISILGDMQNPEIMDGTMKTVLGFCSTMQGEITQVEKRKAYLLTTLMQGAFLRRDVLKQTIGVDFYDKMQRDLFLDTIVESLI